MDRNELVDRCKAIIKEAYEEATEMIVAYLEIHPGEALMTLCREIDPEGYIALESRVRRAQKRRASTGAETGSSRASSVRHARSVLRNADEDDIGGILDALPPKQVERIARASTERLPARKIETAPLDISNLPKTGEAKLNRWFQEGKDLWERHGEDLTDSQAHRFIDKLAGFVAQIASKEVTHA